MFVSVTFFGGICLLLVKKNLQFPLQYEQYEKKSSSGENDYKIFNIHN